MEKLKQYWTIQMRSLKLLFSASKALTLMLMVLVPIQGFLPVLTAMMTSRVIDVLAAATAVSQMKQTLLTLVLIWGGLYILDGVLNPLIMQAQGEFTDRLIHKINDLVFEKSMAIEDLAMAEDDAYYNDVQVIQEEVSWRPINLIIFTLSVFRGIITVASILISLCTFHPLIAVFLLLSLLPQSIVLYRLQQEAYENMVDRSPLSRQLQYFASVMLDREYAKEMRVFRFGGYFRKRYQQVFQTIYAQSNAIRKKKTISTALIFTAGMVICTLSFGYVVHRSLGGSLSVGDVALFASYIILANQTLIVLVQENALLYDTVLFMGKFFSFLDMPLKMTGGKLRLEGGIETIEFRHVTFAYPNAGENALEDLSFRIEKGQKAAFVGKNGSGKSTVFKLMCRLYDVTQGQILVNDRDIREYDIPSLRQQLCVVFQDFARYDMTLEENVRVSSLESSRDLEEILAGAGAEELLDSLPDREKQMLGKRFADGVDLSGGQWQKLAIARALNREGSLVLFDEPSAALDADSEDKFWKAMEAMMAGKTAVYITHRLSGVTYLDQIFVLEAGRLAEKGTHRQLMDQKGIYYTMYKLQADKYIEKED